MKVASFILLLPLIFFSTAASADVPAVMSYQGILTNLVGVALDTTVAMTFSIYNDSTGGSPIWIETQASVEVVRGIFNVLLGRVNPLTDVVFGSSSRWLGVQVGADPELAPRQRIAAAGYAFQAAEADTASFARNAVGGTDSDWTIAGSDMYAGVPGYVGIGTSSPTAKLDIRGPGPDDGVVFRIGNSDESHRIQIYGGRENDPNPYIQWKDGDPLRFSTDAGGWSEKVRFTSDGRIGLGTENPLGKLHVRGGKIYISDAGDSTGLQLAASWIGDHYDGLLRIRSGGDAVVFDDADKIGIGTVSPEKTLHVSSETSSFGMVMLENSLTGDNEATISFKEGSDAGGADLWVAGVGGWGNTNDFVIGRGASKVLITPAGLVGIGTTSPLELLHLYGTDNPTMRVEAPAAATPELSLKRGTESYSVFMSSGNDLSFFKDGTNVIFTDDGKVGIGTTSPSQLLEIEGTGPRILVQATAGNPEFNIQASGQTTWAMYQHSVEGDLRFYQAGDRLTIENSTGNVGIGTVSPSEKLTVRGNLRLESPGTGLPIVELGEGLDYAEGFDVADAQDIAPGCVLVIDPEQPGRLRLCDMPYDGKVAGIVAGGKGRGSGIRLGGGQFDFDVALAGRVYCNVDATYGAVLPGDLLTTSPTPGYAMVVQDRNNAQGAVLGKAMEELEVGRKGQILVLVALQ